MTQRAIEIREYLDTDREWALRLLKVHWMSNSVISRGKLHRADFLQGYVALMEGERTGLLTYDIIENECEIVTLNSLRENRGIGTMLVDAVHKKAIQSGCGRLWLITTNDNLPAVRFYQKLGFELVAIHRGAVNESRELKPEIPDTGIDGIPIRDEIEMELLLS